MYVALEKANGANAGDLAFQQIFFDALTIEEDQQCSNI
jgi:hypothetical protein